MAPNKRGGRSRREMTETEREQSIIMRCRVAGIDDPFGVIAHEREQMQELERIRIEALRAARDHARAYEEVLRAMCERVEGKAADAHDKAANDKTLQDMEKGKHNQDENQQK